MGIESDIYELQEKVQQLTNTLSEIEISIAKSNPQSRYTIQLSNSSNELVTLNVQYNTFQEAHDAMILISKDLNAKRRVGSIYKKAKDQLLKDIEESEFIKNYKSVDEFMKETYLLCINDSYGLKCLHVWDVHLPYTSRIQIVLLKDNSETYMEI